MLQFIRFSNPINCSEVTAMFSGDTKIGKNLLLTGLPHLVVVVIQLFRVRETTFEEMLCSKGTFSFDVLPMNYSYLCVLPSPPCA